MRIVTSPSAVPFVPHPDFTIGIPATMSDPLTTVIVESRHGVGPGGGLLSGFDGQDFVDEIFAQPFISIEGKDEIVLGFPDGMILLFDMSCKFVLDECDLLERSAD
jgi:hypothetical protein